MRHRPEPAPDGLTANRNVDANSLIFLAAILLLAGVLLSKTSSRLGVPSLLRFLVLGMLGGSEGVLGIEFEDFEVAQR